MVKRKCIYCGTIRYSANTQEWICEVCGEVVTRQEGEENVEVII